MKELNKNWDFTAIVKPLMDDQGPAMVVVPRIKNQIDRLKKLRDGFLQKARDVQRPSAGSAALAEAAQSV